jgi:hypothetical protein
MFPENARRIFLGGTLGGWFNKISENTWERKRIPTLTESERLRSHHDFKKFYSKI